MVRYIILYILFHTFVILYVSVHIAFHRIFIILPGLFPPTGLKTIVKEFPTDNIPCSPPGTRPTPGQIAILSTPVFG
jgi:hypothetical protein